MKPSAKDLLNIYKKNYVGSPNMTYQETISVINAMEVCWNLAIEKAAEIPETTNESNIILKLKY